jgi:hypothetical protein
VSRDAEHIDRLQRAINQVLDLEIVQQDTRADIGRDVQRLRETQQALDAARRELAYAEWVAQIPEEGPPSEVSSRV